MIDKDTSPKHRYTPLKVVGFAGIALLFLAAAAWLVMFLWNAILPDVAGVKPLNFWQAGGLLLLAKMLFGGFGRRGRRHRIKEKVKSRWKEKWMAMDQDERQEMKARWEAFCKGKEEKVEEE